MKHLTTIALMANLAITSVYAQQTPVKMTFSGNGAASTIDLKQTNTNTSEEDLAGNGMLGAFTFRLVKASGNSPQPSKMALPRPSSTRASWSIRMAALQGDEQSG